MLFRAQRKTPNSVICIRLFACYVKDVIRSCQWAEHGLQEHHCSCLKQQANSRSAGWCFTLLPDAALCSHLFCFSSEIMENDNCHTLTDQSSINNHGQHENGSLWVHRLISITWPPSPMAERIGGQNGTRVRVVKRDQAQTVSRIMMQSCLWSCFNKRPDSLSEHVTFSKRVKHLSLSGDDHLQNTTLCKTRALKQLHLTSSVWVLVFGS